MGQVDPRKELLTRYNGQPYHGLFHPDLPTPEGNQHGKYLVSSAEQRCKGIAGKTVTKLDFWRFSITMTNWYSGVILSRTIIPLVEQLPTSDLTGWNLTGLPKIYLMWFLQSCAYEVKLHMQVAQKSCWHHSNCCRAKETWRHVLACSLHVEVSLMMLLC